MGYNPFNGTGFILLFDPHTRHPKYDTTCYLLHVSGASVFSAGRTAIISLIRWDHVMFTH